MQPMMRGVQYVVLTTGLYSDEPQMMQVLGIATAREAMLLAG